VRILTGAPLPAGADAVVPVEDTDAAPGVAALPPTVELRRPVEPGAHVRRAGSDISAGTRLLAASRALGPAELATAAAAGHGELLVHRRPVVAVLATGDELAPPGAALGPAQIPDSNSVGLLAMAREAGADTVALGICGDRLAALLAALRRGIEQADVVVVSGGVSVGAHDVVKDAFAELGRIELWRVAVQPGKPLAFGRAGAALLFGLPGNPVSSLVTFELFVRPVVRRLAGHGDLAGREVVRATLSELVRKDPARRAFLRVRLARTDDAPGWRASLAGGQGSHVLSALAAADGLAIVPEGVAELPAGAAVDVIRLRTGSGA
jgi:molybdopterin molybdotransferase